MFSSIFQGIYQIKAAKYSKHKIISNYNSAVKSVTIDVLHHILSLPFELEGHKLHQHENRINLQTQVHKRHLTEIKF